MAPADGRIFISYRRQETAWPARQLYEALCERFGVSQVFKDVDNIAPGEDFVEKITSVVGSCRVLLAMIGPQWLHVADNDGNRRVDDPDDFVRLEVATALSRGVLVVPILVDGARMPKPTELPPDLAGLTRRQAVEISPTGFDLTRLFQALHAVLQEPDDPTVAGSPVPDSAGPPTDPAPESEPEPVVLEPPVPVVEESEPPPPTEPVVEPEPPVPEPEPVRVEPPEPVVEHAEPPPPDAVPEPMPAEPPPPREPVAEPPVPPPPPEPVTVTAAPAPRPARSRLPPVIGGAAVLVVAAGIAAFWPLGNQPAGPSPTAPTVTLAPSTTAPGPVSATVTVDRSVVPTGVSCTVGRVFSLTASGELTAGERTVGADGAAGWFDEAAPLADVPLDALIGRVGDERFFVGDTLTLVCPGDGELELGTNSPDDSGFDGSLTAEIRSRDDLSADDLGIVTVTLPATEAWLDSGFACATDATFRVSATGIAGAANASASARGGPDGVRLRDGEIVPGAALRTAAHRALLGRVDGGDPFLLGSSATLECPADGALELQVNDGVLEDNTGEFSVTLSRWPE